MYRLMLYSFSVIACSGMFLLLYNLFVSRKAGYTFCRKYLLVTMLLSVAIPTLNVPLYHKTVKPLKPVAEVTAPAATKAVSAAPSVTEVNSVPAVTEAVEEAAAENVESTVYRSSGQDKWNVIFICIYFAGVLVSLGLIIRSIIYISGIRRRSILTRRDGYMLAENAEVTSPFSFLHTIFIGKKYTDSERRQIMSHETSHVHHRHSVEKLTMSLIRSLFWFNPFMWMAEKSLEEVQEWQADNDALSDGYNVDDYRDTIIRMLFGMSPLATTGMSTSFTRKRLLRMMEKESKGHAVAVSMLTFALTSALFLCFGCKTVVSEGMVNDDERVLPGQPSFIHTEGDYRKYVGGEDRMFIGVDDLIYAKKGDKSVKNTQFIESYDAFDDIKRGIQILEHPDRESYPTVVCINGYKCADFPSSKELKWVNNKTIIIIGSKVASVEEFRKLKTEDYVAIIYYKAKDKKIPSLVYAITESSIDYSSNYNYASVVNTPEADLLEISEPGGFGVHGSYFISQAGDYNIAITENFAIDGKLVSFEEFSEFYRNRNWRTTLMYRNSQAERVFGQGITEVAELRTWQMPSARVHFSNVGGLIMAVVNGHEYNLSQLANLAQLVGVTPDRPADAPRIYVELMIDDENNKWISDDLIQLIKSYIPWDEPSLIINAFRRTRQESKPSAEFGFNKASRTTLIPLTK